MFGWTLLVQERTLLWVGLTRERGSREEKMGEAGCIAIESSWRTLANEEHFEQKNGG